MSTDIKSGAAVATRTNKYGETEILHKTRHGWRRKQTTESRIIAANQKIAPLIAARIKELRAERGWTLKEMAFAMGIHEGDVKQRMWALENNDTRGHGVRLGTLYRLAEAFGIELRDLLPSNYEIRRSLMEGE